MTDLSYEGANVKISDKLPPYQYCREVGEVVASVQDTGDKLERMLQNVRNLMRNRAAGRGANYVDIETSNTSPFGTSVVLAMSGTAYKCVAYKIKDENNKKLTKSKSFLAADADELDKIDEEETKSRKPTANDKELDKIDESF